MCDVYFVDVRVHGADVAVHGSGVGVHSSGVGVHGSGMGANGSYVSLHGADGGCGQRDWLRRSQEYSQHLGGILEYLFIVLTQK